MQTEHNNLATRHLDRTGNLHLSSLKNYTMADNKKQEKDYTKEVDALLPEADATIKVGLCYFRQCHGPYAVSYSQVNYKRAWTKYSHLRSRHEMSVKCDGVHLFLLTATLGGRSCFNDSISESCRSACLRCERPRPS